MRNLAAGNKTNFTIFIFIIILILVLLIYAIITVLKYEKEEYTIASSACIYDNEYNYIDLSNTATISRKWTGNYYLKEDVTNKGYKLDKYAVAFNDNRTTVDLYGEFYKVSQGGTINKISGYNVSNSKSEDSFYKIDDRKYLIVAKDIKNDTKSLATNNYLIVIIDKLGNALLLNNKTNIKTINSMIISTNSFDFDVANEVLIFKDDIKIDLKKIIGSTNEYVEPEEVINETEENIVIAEDKNTSNSSNSTTIIQNGSNINAGNVNNSSGTTDNKTWVDSLNGWIGNVSNAFTSIYNKEQNSSDEEKYSDNKSIILNSATTGTAYVDINYTINDPEKKYNVVYANISNDNYNYTISLDRNSNSYRFTDLVPDTDYTVSIGYKLINTDNSTESGEEESITVKTTMPNESLSITKVTEDKIYYYLKLDSLYEYDEGAKIVVYVNENEEGTEIHTLGKTDLSAATSNGYVGIIDLEEQRIDNYDSLIIKLENTYYQDKEILTQLKAKIINY